MRKRSCFAGSQGKATGTCAATKACHALAGVAPISPRCSLWWYRCAISRASHCSNSPSVSCAVCSGGRTLFVRLASMDTVAPGRPRRRSIKVRFILSTCPPKCGRRTGRYISSMPYSPQPLRSARLLNSAALSRWRVRGTPLIGQATSAKPSDASQGALGSATRVSNCCGSQILRIGS